MSTPLVTVLARKGSKRLPGKAWRPFHGRPLIDWTIDHARCFEKAVLSADFDWPCVLPNLGRPAVLAEDNAGKLAAIHWVHKQAEMKWQMELNPVIDLDICNPSRTVANVRLALELFEEVKPKTLVSVVKARRKHGYNSFIGAGSPLKPLFGRERLSWDYYELNCCIYIYSREWLLGEDDHPVTERDTVFYLMPDWAFVDIDTKLDFEIAEFLWGKHGLGATNNTGK